MKLDLEPNSNYIKNGRFDQYESLKSVGVKAAVCFKEAVDNKYRFFSFGDAMFIK